MNIDLVEKEYATMKHTSSWSSAQSVLAELLSSPHFSPWTELNEDLFKRIKKEWRVVVRLQRHFSSDMNEWNAMLKKERESNKNWMTIDEQISFYRLFNSSNDLTTKLSNKWFEDAKRNFQQRKELYNKFPWLEPDMLVSSNHTRAKQSHHLDFSERGRSGKPFIITDLLWERWLSTDGLPLNINFQKDSSYHDLAWKARMKRLYKIWFLTSSWDQVSETWDDFFKRWEKILNEIPRLVEHNLKHKENSWVVHWFTHQLVTIMILQHILWKEKYDFEFLFKMNWIYKLWNWYSVFLSYSRESGNDWKLHSYNTVLKHD